MLIKAKIAKNWVTVNTLSNCILGAPGGIGAGAKRNGKANTNAQNARCKEMI